MSGAQGTSHIFQFQLSDSMSKCSFENSFRFMFVCFHVMVRICEIFLVLASVVRCGYCFCRFQFQCSESFVLFLFIWFWCVLFGSIVASRFIGSSLLKMWLAWGARVTPILRMMLSGNKGRCNDCRMLSLTKLCFVGFSLCVFQCFNKGIKLGNSRAQYFNVFRSMSGRFREKPKRYNAVYA